MGLAALLSPEHRFSRWLQGWEFEGLVPALAALAAWPGLLGAPGRRAAYALADARGRVNARFDRDWVSLALQRPHVSAMTRAALAALLPAGAPIEPALRERYQTLAREEFETRLLARRGLAPFALQADAAMQQLAERPAGCGLLLLTAHFETFMLGVAQLAAQGERVHLVISRVSSDPRLHPAIRAHFAKKYAGIERLLHGGRLLEIEDHQRHYYRALKAGEVVVILADAPALSPEAGVWLPWMGQTRAVAQGALRLAASTGSALGGFACHHLGGHRHALALSPLFPPGPGLEQAHEQVFAFLERHIRQAPARWWGMHLLPDYPVASEASMEVSNE